jgi:hypothetical protein
MKRIYWVAVALGAFTLAGAGLWNLWEQDVFWQIRAGRELLQTGKFPTEETWTYTSSGRPWANLQWISTLLLAGMHALGGDLGLIFWRGALIALLFIQFGRILVASQGGASPQGQAADRGFLIFEWALLAPLLFSALALRLQLRPDTFVFLTYARLIELWILPLSERRKITESLAWVALSSNLHAGTTPFLALVAATFYGAQSLRSGGLLRWASFCLALGVAIFLNPYPVQSAQFIWEHFFYSDHNRLTNPDHLPLSVRLFDVSEVGFTGWAWAILSGAGWLSWAISWGSLAHRSKLPAAYQSPTMIGVVGAILTSLCFNRTRAFPYLLIFFLPLVAAELRAIWNRARAQTQLKALAAASFLGWAVLLPAQHALEKQDWGIALHPRLFPVRATEFIRENRPRQNLYHTFTYGAYLVGKLPDYKLFGDPRETPFRHLQDLVSRNFADADQFRQYAREANINTILIPIPKTRQLPGGQWDDVIARFNPASDWALVFFDAISVVIVRRIPEHDELIRKHEFEVLRPNLPPAVPLPPALLQPERARKAWNETQRCLRNQPDLAYCQRALQLLNERKR